MKRLLILIVCFFYFAINVYSQINRNKIWYYGEYAGLDFNSSPPVALNNSAMNQDEGSASIADLNGNILFYTDGSKIWNRNHQLMLNGTGLLGGFSSTQSALIVPKPQDNNTFYVFIVPSQGSTAPFSYSVVDMSLDNGLGAVIDKNVALYGPVDEKLSGTLKSNGIDYWIIAKGSTNNAFVTYSLTAAGLNPVPVISNVGSIFTNSNDKIGFARFSPNGSKLCVSYVHRGICQLFDFDLNTGIVSNPFELTVNKPYGIAFSSDNSKLYVLQAGLNCILWQYNLLAGSPTNIQNSAYKVAEPVINPGYQEYGGAIALGPDEKVYISYYHRRYLSIINQPNLIGPACNYTHIGVNVGPRRNKLGLPNQIYYPPTIPCREIQNLEYHVSICSNQSYQLPSGAIVNSSGIYLDTIKNQDGNCDSIAYSINLSVFAYSNVDTTVFICPSNSYSLPSGIIVRNEGTYFDTLKSLSGCDSIIFTINVNMHAITNTNIIDSFFTGQLYTVPSGISVSSPGIYVNTLINSVGCDSIVTLTLKEVTFSDCIVLNNAFTPNGDGINDRWVLYRQRCFKRLEVYVYNRYGNLVFRAHDYYNDWDGMYKSKNLPDATYYFVLKLLTFNNIQRVINGNVTIVR